MWFSLPNRGVAPSQRTCKTGSGPFSAGSHEGMGLRQLQSEELTTTCTCSSLFPPPATRNSYAITKRRFVKMTERNRQAALSMATRLWSIQRQCLSPKPDDRLYQFASRTSPYAQFRRRIHFVSEKACYRLRPKIRIGLTAVPTGLASFALPHPRR